MSAPQITVWLKSIDLDVRQIASEYWQVTICHTLACYLLHIRNHNGWLSFGAELIALSTENKPQLINQFYSFVLSYNARINGAHIALEGHKLILIRDEFIGSVNSETVKRGVQYFHQTHEVVYKTLLEEAQRLDIRLAK